MLPHAGKMRCAHNRDAPHKLAHSRIGQIVSHPFRRISTSLSLPFPTSHPPTHTHTLTFCSSAMIANSARINPPEKDEKTISRAPRKTPGSPLFYRLGMDTESRPFSSPPRDWKWRILGEGTCVLVHIDTYAYARFPRARQVTQATPVRYFLLKRVDFPFEGF